MKVGDLVKQRSSGIVMISPSIQKDLNMDCIGIIIEIENGVYYSYDGRDRLNVKVLWSNGKTETIPEIYLEVIEDEQ